MEILDCVALREVRTIDEHSSIAEHGGTKTSCRTARCRRALRPSRSIAGRRRGLGARRLVKRRKRRGGVACLPSSSRQNSTPDRRPPTRRGSDGSVAESLFSPCGEHRSARETRPCPPVRRGVGRLLLAEPMIGPRHPKQQSVPGASSARIMSSPSRPRQRPVVVPSGFLMIPSPPT